MASGSHIRPIRPIQFGGRKGFNHVSLPLPTISFDSLGRELILEVHRSQMCVLRSNPLNTAEGATSWGEQADKMHKMLMCSRVEC